MYPNKVYHCPCVSLEIKLCLINGQYSLKDICNRLNQSKEHRRIYCCKCGDGLQNIIFSCINHIKQKTKTSCRSCLRKHLQAIYSRCYEHTDFNVPAEIKKKKKTLCLRLTKI